MMHRRVLHRQKFQQPNTLGLAIVMERHAEDMLRAVIVRPVVKDKPRALLGTLDAPARENSGDLDHVLLCVSAIDADRVQLKQLARIIFIDPRRQAPVPLLGHFIHAKSGPAKWREDDWGPARRRSWRYTLRVVEIKQHRGTLGRRDEEVLKAAECPGTDRFLYIGWQQEAVRSFAHKDVEMIGPEVDHDLAQLPLRNRGTHNRKLLQLTTQLAELPHRAGPLQRRRVAARGRLTLHPLALADRIAVAARQIGAIVVEDLELPLALCKMLVRDAIGIELLIDPAHDADARDTVNFARAGPIRQTIQCMECRITRREHGRGLLHEKREQGGDVHVTLMTFRAPVPLRHGPRT